VLVEPYLFDDEDDEYCDETRLELSPLEVSTLEVLAEVTPLSLSCLSWSSDDLSCDSSSWILELAVLSLSSSSLTLPASEAPIEAELLN